MDDPPELDIPPPLPATPVRRRGPIVKYTRRKLALDPPAPKGPKKRKLPPWVVALIQKAQNKKKSYQAPLILSGEREEKDLILSIPKENRLPLRKKSPKKEEIS